MEWLLLPYFAVGMLIGIIIFMGILKSEGDRLEKLYATGGKKEWNDADSELQFYIFMTILIMILWPLAIVISMILPNPPQAITATEHTPEGPH